MTPRRAAVAALLLAACDVDRPWPSLEPSLERMLVQPHAAPYQASAVFADGKAMQSSPAGTRPHEAPSRHAHTGDLSLTKAELEQGRTKFEIVCATCHGVLGDGDTPVAKHLTLRRPPSLHEARIRAYSPARLFGVVTEGYGAMPSYAAELSEDDRWAIVGYVHALQLSFSAELASLPPNVRAEAERELP